MNTNSPRRFRGLITDIDGTITDARRRIHTGAIESIRQLVDAGVCVVLASGNTACFMDALSNMTGTGGVYIGENGGIVRSGWNSGLSVLADGTAPRVALWDLVSACRKEVSRSNITAFPTGSWMSHSPGHSPFPS